MKARNTKAGQLQGLAFVAIAISHSGNVRAFDPRSALLTTIHCTGTFTVEINNAPISNPIEFVVSFNSKKVVNIEGLRFNSEDIGAFSTSVTEFAIVVNGQKQRPKKAADDPSITYVDDYSLKVDRADSSFLYFWGVLQNSVQALYAHGSGTCQPFKQAF